MEPQSSMTLKLDKKTILDIFTLVFPENNPLYGHDLNRILSSRNKRVYGACFLTKENLCKRLLLDIFKLVFASKA